VQVYTGSGKGKTTAAWGQALRACGWGMRAVVIQFMKDGRNSGEIAASTSIENLKFECFGSGDFVEKGQLLPEDLRLAAEGLRKAEEILGAGSCDILILDEINVAVDFGLIEEEAVLRLLDLRPPNMQLVLTGRGARAAIIQRADLVTEMREIKHPYASGRKAEKGIEY
jgi:cob(I)alamin adenosyltransferase